MLKLRQRRGLLLWREAKHLIKQAGLIFGFCCLVGLTGCVEGRPVDSNVINGTIGGEPFGGDVGGGDGGWGGFSGGSVVEGDRPNLMRIGDKVAVVGQPLEIRLQATPSVGVTFNLRSALPEGAHFDKMQGYFSWVPVPDQAGRSFLLTFEVAKDSLKDQETIAVSVSAAGSSQPLPPRLDPIGDQLLIAGQLWSYQLVGEDPNGQALTYRLNGMIPVGMELNPMTGLVHWTPTIADVGRKSLLAAVSDGESEVTQPMTLIVRDSNEMSSTNTPPVFDQLPPQQVIAGETLTFMINARDDQPSSLVYAEEMLPQGAQFLPGSRTFSWSPSQDQAGNVYDAVFRVSDPDFRNFLRVQIEVLHPARDCPPDQAGMRGGQASLADGVNLQSRQLCDQSEVDLYLITLNQTRALEIIVTFDDRQGDIDILLKSSTGALIGSSTGVTGTERITTQGLDSGNYILEVRLFDRGGPILYSVGYTTLDPSAVCMDDPFEGSLGNQTEATASPLPTMMTHTLSLCSQDIDFFSFHVDRGQSINVNAIFRHDIANIDLRLIAPRDASGLPFTTWSATSFTNNEEIEVPSAPISGVYKLEVRQNPADREINYDLSVELGQATFCSNDRLEPNDDISDAEPLTPQLYYNLSSCSDEDWFRTQVPTGRSLILYLTYDFGTPIVEATGSYGDLIPTSVTFDDPVDGCLPERVQCKRYQIDPGPSGGLVSYNISFFEVGTDYELRVRVGDEVGAACADELDCNPGFQCLSDFDTYQFYDGLCAEPCSSNAECGSNRVCMIDYFGDGYCMQRCDQGLSCRYQFECQSGISTVSGEVAAVCLSNDFD